MTKKADKTSLTATKMRVVLSSTLVLVLISMLSGVYFAYTLLSNVANEVSQAQTVAQSADQEIDRLELLKKQLQKYTSIVEKSNYIVANKQTYQDQVVADLTSYARQAKIEIISFTFQETSSSDDTPQQQPEPGEATEGPSDASPSGAAKSIHTTVQLGENTDYQNVLHFIYLIENNLTRMQIANLPLTRSAENGGIGPVSLEIEVYVK